MKKFYLHFCMAKGGGRAKKLQDKVQTYGKKHEKLQSEYAEYGKIRFCIIRFAFTILILHETS